MLTREAIVAEARAQVEAAGFEALSLRAVARAVEVTAPALYDHVESKADLLAAVAAEGYQELVARFDALGDEPLGARLRSRAVAYVRFAADHPELFRLMFQYRPVEIPLEVDNELPAATQAFEANLADVAEAVDSGLLAARDPLELALLLWAGIHGAATVAQMVPTGDHEQLAADLIEALLAGLAPTA